MDSESQLSRTSVDKSRKKINIISQRPQLPKLYTCLTKTNLEIERNNLIHKTQILDFRQVRRKRNPTYECILLELREAGFVEAAQYLHDVMYDNIQILAADDIGITVDLRTRGEYLDHIADNLKEAEKYKMLCMTQLESRMFIELALIYAEKGKGLLWLAEKFFLAGTAIASKYHSDGGRWQGCCKYHYAKFMLTKFPDADNEEPLTILASVRDACLGKPWMLYELDDQYLKKEKDEEKPKLLEAVAVLMHGITLKNARDIRPSDAPKSERLTRLAERRATEANDPVLYSEAMLELGISQLAMNNVNNARKTIYKVLKLNVKIQNIPGICEGKKYMSFALQRQGDYEGAVASLTEMGTVAIEHGMRRQLGEALHLLGELHLAMQRPELATQHLVEAFSCFIGVHGQYSSIAKTNKNMDDNFEIKSTEKEVVVYAKEAEMSRFLMAVSAGEELMPTYMNMIIKSKLCNVQRVKIIEWKLHKAQWHIQLPEHNLIPCLCPIHNRTPLDVIKIRQEMLEKEKNEEIMATKSVSYLRRDTEGNESQNFNINNEDEQNNLNDSPGFNAEPPS